MGQVELHVLVHEEGHPGGGHDADDAGDHAAVEAPDALVLPRPPHDAADAPAVVLVGVEVLQPAPDDLVRVCGGAGDHLGRAREQHGRRVAELERALGRRRFGEALFLAPYAPRKVEPLRRLVHGELHRAVARADQANAQAAVEAPNTFRPQELDRAGPHARVRADGPSVRGEHAHLEDPNGIGHDLDAGAGQGSGDKIVGGRQGGSRLGLETPDGTLGAGLEEEEGGPARGVAHQVGGQAAVEGAQRLGRLNQGAHKRDGRQAGRGRGAAAVQLHARLDDVEGVDHERGHGARGQPGDGLDEGG